VLVPVLFQLFVGIGRALDRGTPAP
jgi:hypothetical protein